MQDRLAHKVIEKRRRDKMNDLLDQLRSLIPEHKMNPYLKVIFNNNLYPN